MIVLLRNNINETVGFYFETCSSDSNKKNWHFMCPKRLCVIFKHALTLNGLSLVKRKQILSWMEENESKCTE